MPPTDPYRTYVDSSNIVTGWVEHGFFETLKNIEEMLQKSGVSGPVAEIGTHCGKLLLAMALVSGDRPDVLAIDNFENGQSIRQQLESHIKQFYDPDLVTIVESDSLQITPATILSHLPSRPKYFSVDGFHQAEFVFNDLILAQETVRHGGVVIVDDFMSPAWPGVFTAVLDFCRYTGRKLVPFAYGENKLLMTTHSHRAKYFEHFRSLDASHKADIGQYPCAYFKPDVKWFAGSWNE